MANLYIIGNGFDLYHGFKTSYKDFKRFLIENDNQDDSDLYNEIVFAEKNHCFNGELKGDWSNIENCLFLDYYHISEHIKYDVYDYLIRAFQKCFNSWIFDINKFDIARYKGKSIDSLTNDDFYLSFNYTHTLELVYKINQFDGNKTKIHYIHNCVIGNTEEDKNDFCDVYDDNKIVFGSCHNSLFNDDKEIIKNFKTRFYKNTVRRIELLDDRFLKDINSIDKVVVLGHSMDAKNGDMDYFKHLLKRFNNIPWFVSWYNRADYDRKKNLLKEYNNVNYVEFK